MTEANNLAESEDCNDCKEHPRYVVGSAESAYILDLETKEENEVDSGTRKEWFCKAHLPEWMQWQGDNEEDSSEEDSDECSSLPS